MSHDTGALDKIPTGWSRAPATARIALRLGASGAARLLGGRAQADERLGEALLSELDQLKGMAMKVGQILSYMDVGLPSEVTERLAALQRGVKPLPGEAIVPIIERELGAPVSELFAAFEPQAIAAASIGQVHRGRTRDGQEVAIKVCYPEIASSFDDDFRKLERLGALAGLFTAVDGRALVAELHARVRQECDYRREAAWQQRFAAIFRDDEAIVVPRVLSELSSAGVLTSCFHHGAELALFCARAGAEERSRAAEALARFMFRPLLRHGVLHADPHPGNQLFLPSGVVALDFGCVRAFDAPFMEAYRAFSLALLEGERRRFRDGAVALGLAPQPDKLDFDELWQLYRWLYGPLIAERFQFSQQWWAQGRAFTSPSRTNARYQGFPPEWIWLQRMQWGLWAVLVRLQAHARLAAGFRGDLEAGPAERSAAPSVLSLPGEAHA